MKAMTESLHKKYTDEWAILLRTSSNNLDRAITKKKSDQDYRSGHSNRQISDHGMRNQSRLNKKIDDLQRHWELLNEKLNKLNEQWILETHVDEKLRLRNLIDDAQTQRDQVEGQLKDMEGQLAKIDGDTEKVTVRNGDQGQEKLKDLQAQLFKEAPGRVDDQIQKSPKEIRNHFKSYRRAADKRFQDVDRYLNVYCEDLRRIGESLTLVIKVIE